MNVTVIGSGYVGLVMGACLADAGNTVTCVDSDLDKIRILRGGRVPIYEPGLEEIVRRNVSARRLAFAGRLDSVSRAEVIFIAVGTPSGEDGSADVQHVLQAAEDIGRALERYAVVVVKSTVPVGTAERVREVIASVSQVPVDVVSNPEFLKEGAAVADFLEPDRIIIGTASARAWRTLGELFAPFVRPGKPILHMGNRSAELAKYAANAMLATRISFMNDLALLCERAGADAEQVRLGMGSDPRIGPAFLQPGIGYGGSCFPKDVRALQATGRQFGVALDILAAVERTNARQKRLLLGKALAHFGSLSGKFFAVWGLSFKGNTDDIREAPALEVIEGLLGSGARVRCHDPVAEPVAERRFGARILYAPSIYDCVEGADGLFLVTDWPQFREPDLVRVKSLMRNPVIFDGRNLLDPETVRRMGFTYFSVGRP